MRGGDDRLPLEIWGGLECSRVRIGEAYRDELDETGHAAREGDLDLLAGLGLRKLRYPLLWEAALDDAGRWDWRAHDARVAGLEARGLEPIVGLVHHGSGPRHTHLLDEGFAEGLAAYAGAAAARYPGLGWFTPVNEPLTTARFSALYGHWYPHARDHDSFLRAVFIQCRATLLAMRAVRAHRPDARLVQTEDLGKTFSTPRLAYQAAYENERRWLSLDLLAGRVDRDHPWRGRFLRAGAPASQLDDFLSGDARPDILGINHYLTSDRFLDERVERYPPALHGGNGRDAYADVEAVRMPLAPGEVGPAARLREAWRRYRLPLAVTEIHHGCTRDEQLRWLADVVAAAHEVRAEGADLRAVTVWALLGSVDWNSLLVRKDGVYEPGCFDVRGARPRPTALARATRSLAVSGRFDHPVLDTPGWWRRPTRFYSRNEGVDDAPHAGRKILITGRTGTLGRAVARICVERGLDHVLLDRTDMDIDDERAVAAALRLHRPWAVVNAAGFVRVADAARERDACFRDNVSGPRTLARLCADRGVPLVTFSSDLVFDGTLGRAYLESDDPSPRCVYGESKALAERAVLEAHPTSLVVRTSAFFGPWDEHNFAWRTLCAAAQGRLEPASADVVSPTYVPDLAHTVLDLAIDAAHGIHHVANPGACSWAQFAAEICLRAGLPASEAAAAKEARRDTSLATARAVRLPPLPAAIERFVRDVDPRWREAA
jgi:dTDP-4-dehydrorhamnose reductase